MRVIKYAIIAVLWLSIPASAKEFTISEQDQVNILNICDAASTTPSLNRNTRAAVAAWCVDWAKRVQAASPGGEVPQPGASDDDQKK